MRLTSFIILLGLVAISCSGHSRQAPSPEFPLQELREGDLAFRCGMGVFSRAVTTSEQKGIYSHVGLLVKDGDSWKVVHAVPGEKVSKADFDRVKAEELSVFYGPLRACRGALVHTGLTDSAKVAQMVSAALQSARDSVLFDHDYSLEDSSKLYCTELVWRLYRRAGIDLSEGRRKSIHALHIQGECLLPEHLFDYSSNIIYFNF